VIRLKDAPLVAEFPKDFSNEGHYVTALIEEAKMPRKANTGLDTTENNQ
jgi:hypothetical protein